MDHHGMSPQGKVWLTGFPGPQWQRERQTPREIRVRLEPYSTPGIDTIWQAVQTLDSGPVPKKEDTYFWLGVVERQLSRPKRGRDTEQMVVWAIVGHHGGGEYI
jgi:hypothetical protein